MRNLLEYMLSMLFPPEELKIEEWEESQESSNHPEQDPARPLGYHESGAKRLE